MIDGLLSVTRGVGAVAAVVAVLLAMAPRAGAQSPMLAAASPTARVWFYQDASPYVSINYATVSMNGSVAGAVPPYGGSLYRDVPPGHYHLTVLSEGLDVNQATDVDLAPGQEVYVKVLNSPDWATGNLGSVRRDTYYLRPIPTATARAELAQQHRF